MKNILGALLVLGLIVVVGFYALNSYIYSEKQGDPSQRGAVVLDGGMTDDGHVLTSYDDGVLGVTAVSHATMVLTWDGLTIFNDPTGGLSAFAGWGEPDVILVSDVHGDHLDDATLDAVMGEGTVLIAPQAVIDELHEALASRATALANDETVEVDGLSITGVPMYNLPEDDESRHVKGRGNGYLLEKDGYRVYVAGDTAGIPEMRALTGIDVAFIPMNLPYTMDVEEAADAVLEFAPALVYPYHYRTPEGFSDVATFAGLVRDGNPDIEVVQLDWYAGSR